VSALPVRVPRSRAPESRAWRPPLRIVRAPHPARSRLPFLLLCLTILGGSLLGALALNTSMATGAYQLRDRQAELAALTESEQQLAGELDSLSSPAQLARTASRLGMEPAAGLSYITLADGTVTGPATEEQTP
jgi:hypothetical protein